MNGEFNLRQTTGLLFILAAVAFGIAATVLSMSFEWPDILREDPAYVLTKYQEGGTTLTLIWLAVAWTFFLLIFPIVMLGKVLDEDGKSTLVSVATMIGVLAVIASTVGFLRWVFVVPDLVDLYFAPDATEAARSGVVASYTAQHQFGGSLLGEHVGQMLSVIWTGLIGVAMLRSGRFPNWLAYFGFVAGGVYFLAQGEVMETAIDGFPVLDIAGLAGSTLWGLWILTIGVVMLRRRTDYAAVWQTNQGAALTPAKAVS
jgi:hypothetical protein